MVQRHDGAWRAATPGVAPRAMQAQRAQPPARGVAAGAIVNWVGAVLSLALLTGVSLWSYRLLVRDVTGVPVVQALSGPMRMAPDDPGGRRAAHQGLAVNAVAAEGQAAPTADKITLAPSPVALKPEDRVAQGRTDGAKPRSEPSRETGDSEARASARSSGAHSPSPERSDDPGPLPDTILARSPVPPARPGSLVARPAVAAAGEGRVVNASLAIGAGGQDAQAEALLDQLTTRMASARDIDIDPRAMEPGTRLVQLGAYDDEAEARAAWAVLEDRFPAQFDGRGRVIEEAVAGGRSFYRLRAHGFADEPEARRFCAVFTEYGVDCIPVLVR